MHMCVVYVCIVNLSAYRTFGKGRKQVACVEFYFNNHVAIAKNNVLVIHYSATVCVCIDKRQWLSLPNRRSSV